MPHFTVTEPGVLKLLNNINPSKAGGPDGLPARALKELATEIAPVLSTIFCQSLNTGEVPTEWRTQWGISYIQKRCEMSSSKLSTCIVDVYHQ